MPQNPFTFGNPVIDQALFIGRKNEINQIVNRLLSPAHESTSLVGSSRMGNTSLLKYLSDRDSSAERGLHPDKYCLVYIDFQGQPEISPNIFWKRIFTSIYRTTVKPEIKELARKYQQMGEYDMFDLEDFFQEISDLDIVMVLFMDEFEYVTQSPNISGDFWGGLRSLAIHENLPLIPATRHELVDLCHSKDIKGSPFFNIFATVHLEPFSAADSDLMLELYLAKSGLKHTQEEKRFIASLGDGHPYFLQMTGYYWYHGKEAGLEGKRLSEYVLNNYYQQSIPHLKDLWSMCDQQEQTLLRAITIGDKGNQAASTPLGDGLRDRKFSTALENLVKTGLIDQRGEKLVINLPCLDKFLREEILPEAQVVTPFIESIDRQDLKPHPTSFEVFISHSTRDKVKADLVVARLESKGITCWIAPRDIQPGTPYPEAIIKALNSCRFMVVIFSKAANESDQVMQEVERAVAKKLVIIPIRIEDILPTGSLELMLSSRHWLDAYNSPLESHINTLAKSIRG